MKKKEDRNKQTKAKRKTKKKTSQENKKISKKAQKKRKKTVFILLLHIGLFIILYDI